MGKPRKIDVAGLNVDAITKAQLLKEIAARISRKQKTFVVTPYSEFLYAGLRNRKIRDLLNTADFSIADGIGILWAHLFLSQPFTWPGYYLKILQAYWQVVWTGASILLRPSLLYKDIPEKIVGADFIWDLAELAAKNQFSIYILGGWGNTDKMVAEKFLNKYPNLKIVGTSNKKVDDPSIFSDITKANPDMLLVGLGPLVQEQWIHDNLKDLPASFAIGLGGTFDYIAGVKRKPPQWVRTAGLEWLYRLITQPSRVRRIFEATWGLVLALMRVKVFSYMPLRITAVAVIRNKDGKILLCKQNAPVTRKFYSHLPNYENWQFPQGGLEKDEQVAIGAQRELKEETGITTVKLLGVAKHEKKYEWANALRPFLTSNYRARGSDLRTVFFQFLGNDDEIKLDNKELESYQWVAPEDIEKIIAEERRPHATVVLAELAEIQVN